MTKENLYMARIKLGYGNLRLGREEEVTGRNLEEAKMNLYEEVTKRFVPLFLKIESIERV